MKIESVYNEKNACCGCGACVAICPKSAISMKKDFEGFLYPVIDSSLCIGCEKCVRNCTYNNAQLMSPISIYAAACKDKPTIMNSSSGGIFPAIAERIIEMGGYVVGSATILAENEIRVEHIIVESKEEIVKLQGSKYAHSEIPKGVYESMAKAIKEGRYVLFSGTPCQVAQVRQQYNDPPNLFCMDIICHGVPSITYLNEHIRTKCGNQNLKSIVFREKKQGWGLKGAIVFENAGVDKTIEFTPNSSSYYHYFLNGDIYRDNCYVCPYAKESRAGDITIGDYWGVEKLQPEFMIDNGGCFEQRLGVSCLLVNSEKGQRLIQTGDEGIVLKPTTISNVSKINTQLREPARPTKKRKQIKTFIRLFSGWYGAEVLYSLDKKWAQIKKTVKQIL